MGELKEDECCEDWKPNLDKINGFIQLAAVRSGNFSIYTGKPFVFCPWCGQKRPENAPVA